MLKYFASAILNAVLPIAVGPTMEMRYVFEVFMDEFFRKSKGTVKKEETKVWF